MKRVLLLITLFFSLSSWALPSLSFLQKEYNMVNWASGVSYSVTINAPVSEVWDYVSDSHNATDWSVYFDHISPLPGVADGQVGSKRRCFRNADETGPRWDEITILIKKESLRAITTFNLVGYPMSYFTRQSYVFVNQIYRAIDRNTTELTFQTAYSPLNGFVTRLGFDKSREETLIIFEQNLNNIKDILESQSRAN